MKILIIRFSSIGDIVLTTPVVRCLKEQASAEIHYLTKKSFEKILLSNPNIDHVWSIEKKISDIIPHLKTENFDYIIDLHKNLRSWHIKWALRKPVLSFNKLNIEKWLMVNFKINRLPPTHIVDRYLATLTPLSIVNDNKGLDYFIPQNDEVDISHYIKDNQPYIAFVIGAAHSTKRLPNDKIIDICNQIQAPIILLGGKEDAVNAHQIKTKCIGNITNLCGELNLNQSASVVRQAYKVITHDTGLMHIAAAFNKEIISIWGNTIPAFGMYPYIPMQVQKVLENSVEVKNLSCRPCSKIGYNKCPKRHFKCMNDIDTEGVVSRVMYGEW